MAMSHDDSKQFTAWLEQNTSLAARSIRDVVSRTRRVQKMLNPLKAESREELAFRLSKNREYNAASASVKSQLKRAAELYRRYKAGNKGGGG